MPSPDIHRRCRDAVAEVIKTLNYDGMVPVDRIISADEFRPELNVMPCVSVTFGAQEQIKGSGTNCRDDVGYPILVMLHDTGRPLGVDADGVQLGPDPTALRQKLRETFHLLQPAIVAAMVPELYQTEYGPGPLIDVSKPQYQHLKTVVTITVVCRVARGN